MSLLDYLDTGNKWANLVLWTVLLFALVSLIVGMTAIAPPVGIVGALVACAAAAYLLLRRKS